MTQHGRTLAVPAGWLLASLIHGAFCIKITDIQIPKYIVKGSEEVTFRCQYDPEGSDIYAIKWYKDKQEFYNFLPQISNQKGVYNITGFNVIVNKSTDSKVVLGNIQYQATGTYKCEISGEGPNFWTASQEKHVSVVAPPESGPKIWGYRHAYRPGDTISVNCTASDSRPAAEVDWLVNSEQVSQDNIRRWIFPSADSLLSTTAELRLTARRHHFKRGVLNLKCTAALGDVYWTTASLDLPLWRADSERRRSSASPRSRIRWRFLVAMLLLHLSAVLTRMHH